MPTRPQRRTYKKTSTRLFKKPPPKKTPLLPAGKKARVKSNAIFKETKNRTDEEVHARFSVALPASYYNQNPIVPHLWPHAGDKVFPLKIFALDAQQQGIDEEMMNGRALYAKYLKMKIQLTFPEATNVPQDQPDIYLIHGYIKTSPNLNGINTVKGVTDPTAWTLQNDWDWIRSELEPYFNDREDKLRYIEKQNSNLAIIDYHRVVPKVRQGFGRQRTTAVQFGDPTNQVLSVGTLMDYHRTLNWKMMRKYHYQVGADSQFQSEAAHISRSNGLYINMNQWRPFACLYCPQLGDTVTNPPLTPANLPKVAYNSKIYYTDS